MEQRKSIKIESLVEWVGNFADGFVPGGGWESTLISTDQEQFGDMRVLHETETKLVVEIKMKKDETVYRRLYFKSYPDQVQSEIVHISETQKQINLDDFSIYKSIVALAESLKVDPAKAPSALVLGAGCSVLGDCLRDRGFGRVVEVDIDAEVFELGNRFFRSERYQQFKEGFQVVADAFEYVVGSGAVETFEVIVLDINGGECTPPRQFLQVEFFEGLKRYCGAESRVFVNCILKSSLDYEELERCSAGCFEIVENFSFDSIKNKMAVLRLKAN